MKKITIGIPCYNEEDNIELMYKAVTAQMQLLKNYDYEIIFADNSSSDNSQSIIKEICYRDKHVKAIFNQTNFGPARSGINLYKNASGDAYIGIACDFQEPPEMIPQMIAEWEKGHDIVWGQKIKSKESPLKYACRSLYYWIIDKMSDYPQMKQVVGFGLLSKKAIAILLETQLQDPDYSARNLACEYGLNIKLLPYIQNKRERGKSSYNIRSYFTFAITSLCNTSIKPLHFMTVLGFTGGVFSILVAMFYFVLKLVFWDSFKMGMAPVLIGLFLVSSIQLFSIGMLGEYIAVIVKRITNKPLVIEKERINFEKDNNE